MKFPKLVINSFAVLGVTSLFLYTCAAADIDETDNTTPNPPINSGGIYQVSRAGGDGSLIVVLNSETGVMKTYRGDINANGWAESSDFAEINFTH